MWAVDKAQELWKQKSSTGFSCNTCHSEPQTTFKTWAASMPKWEPRLNKVLGVEEFVTRHAKATTGANWLMETDDNLAMSVYLRFLANGEPIKLDASSADAKAELEITFELARLAREAVHDAAGELRARVGEDAREVVVRAPLVQEDRLAELSRQLELQLECAPLLGTWRKIAIVIEPAFTDGDDLGGAGDGA